MTDPRTGNRWLLGDKFDQVYPHQESIAALWEKLWKFPCQRSLYPFHDGKYEDFEPTFNILIEKDINDGYSIEYTREFLPSGERLVKEADELAAKGERKQAIDLYLRACAVYRIARFPYLINDLKREVFEAQKRAYMKAAALFDVPMKDVRIPHTAGATNDEAKEVPLYVRIPPAATIDDPCPTVIIICGLDGHRPDFTIRSNEILSRGWATVIVDCPGTADCPADRKDPTSPDRLLTTILDWMTEQSSLDMSKVIVWGLSAGGHNGVRAAHTHATRLAGAVGHGAGTHHFFSRSWLEKADGHEYPWRVVKALALKYGYHSEDEFMDNVQKDFSLLLTGVLDMPSTRLLLVNGTHDGLMPIEDSTLLLEYGSPKEARLFQGLRHMGYPPANSCVYPWMESIVGIWKPRAT